MRSVFTLPDGTTVLVIRLLHRSHFLHVIVKHEPIEKRLSPESMELRSGWWDQGLDHPHEWLETCSRPAPNDRAPFRVLAFKV